MAKTQRNLVATLVMVAGLVGGSRVLRAEGEPRSIIVHVDNFAKVSAATLADAQRRAAAIYAAAGVRTVWVDGDSEVVTSGDASALHVRVVLLSRELSDLRIKADRVPDGVMGLAYKAARRAYIFYPRIADLAMKKSSLVNDVLSRVLAHEVGHLVLATGHSDRGIMQADLELRRSAPLRFTAAQITNIHTELVMANRAN